MVDNLQNLEKKIGEALGLEKASQAAVENLTAKGILNCTTLNRAVSVIITPVYGLISRH